MASVANCYTDELFSTLFLTITCSTCFWDDIYIYILWRFPKIEVPLVIIHFSGIFPYKPCSYWGTPICGNLHIRLLLSIWLHPPSWAMFGFQISSSSISPGASGILSGWHQHPHLGPQHLHFIRLYCS